MARRREYLRAELLRVPAASCTGDGGNSSHAALADKHTVQSVAETACLVAAASECGSERSSCRLPESFDCTDGASCSQNESFKFDYLMCF